MTPRPRMEAAVLGGKRGMPIRRSAQADSAAAERTAASRTRVQGVISFSGTNACLSAGEESWASVSEFLPRTRVARFGLVSAVLSRGSGLRSESAGTGH